MVPLATDLAPGAFAELLRGVVTSGTATPFTGAVGVDGFVIARMNEFRSTVMPLLRGRFFAGPGGGTRVLLRLSPPRTVVAFMGVWLAFLAAIAAIVVAAHALDTGRSLLTLLVPAGLGTFTWFLMTAVFAADARWAVEHLVDAVPDLRPDGGP